jgi:hypothetical protein
MERQPGRSEAVGRSVAGVSWGKQVVWITGWAVGRTSCAGAGGFLATEGPTSGAETKLKRNGERQ